MELSSERKNCASTSICGKTVETMTVPSREQLTQLLVAWSDGDSQALDQLSPLVYAELKRLARRHLAGEGSAYTLESGALVNEAFMKLIDWKNVRWQNRAHFFAVSAQMMRHILVDYARTKNAQRRGDGRRPLPLIEAVVVQSERAREFVALDEALERLARLDERKSKVVELRYFGGLSVEETAEVLQVSAITVMRDWQFARSWLEREISDFQG
jgi:RNA polymerase sigma-70 factor (ECF subfamily)